MPTDACAVQLQTIDPSCEAFRKRGGVSKRMYFGNVSDIQGITYDADGAILTLSLESGKFLTAFNGRNFTNNAGFGMTRLENGVIDWNHSTLFVGSEITQADMNAIQAAAEAENLFAIVQVNFGKLKVYGLNGGTDFLSSTGLRVNTLEANTGTASGDTANVPLLFEGTADSPPRYFVGATGVLATNLGILDALLEPDV